MPHAGPQTGEDQQGAGGGVERTLGVALRPWPQIKVVKAQVSLQCL